MNGWARRSSRREVSFENPKYDFIDFIYFTNISKALQEKKEEQLQTARQYEEYRRSLSEAFYRKWCDVSAVKPRPVPLNRGFKTLMGSTTSLYINPDPWTYDNWEENTSDRFNETILQQFMLIL